MKNLGDMEIQELVTFFCWKFPWLKKDAGFVRDCLKWQASVQPRPNFYFRGHLPRLVTTLQIMSSVLERGTRPRILDLATYPPFAVMMNAYLKGRGVNPEWERTTIDGVDYAFTQGGISETVECNSVNLDGGRLPFEDNSFDFIVFAETLEHLMIHPQSTLLEINRILRPNGHVLVTTPNVTSWKKIYGMTNGDWDFDSPTFSDEWGHRYEYSYYQLQMLLRASGFSPVSLKARDVYRDDPIGMNQALQFWGLVAVKFAAGRVKQACKLVSRRGSTLFFLYKKSSQFSDGCSFSRVVI